jgi:hypothetical protein
VAISLGYDLELVDVTDILLGSQGSDPNTTARSLDSVKPLVKTSAVFSLQLTNDNGLGWYICAMAVGIIDGTFEETERSIAVKIGVCGDQQVSGYVKSLTRRPVESQS